MINLLFESLVGLFFCQTCNGHLDFLAAPISIKCKLHCAIILFDYSALQSWIIMAGCLLRFLVFHANKD